MNQESETAPSTGWRFKPEAGQATGTANQNVQAVEWTASEYIANQKGSGWYALLVVGTVVAAAVVYLLTRDIISVVVVCFLAVAFAILAGREPKVLKYSVDAHGLHIGNKTYPYHTFKSFSVIDEGAVNSIMLMPLKRFMPPISIYYAPEDEERILATLSSFLPVEPRQRDALDRLMHKIRF